MTFLTGEDAFEYKSILLTRSEAVQREIYLANVISEDYNFFVALEYPNRSGLLWARRNLTRLTEINNDLIEAFSDLFEVRPFHLNQYYTMWFGFYDFTHADMFEKMARK